MATCKNPFVNESVFSDMRRYAPLTLYQHNCRMWTCCVGRVAFCRESLA